MMQRKGGLEGHMLGGRRGWCQADVEEMCIHARKRGGECLGNMVKCTDP